MMGPRQEALAALFYEFSLEDHVPDDHLLRSIDWFVDLAGIRQHLTPFYGHTGRPSIDPELLIRMLIVGYCFGIRSERRLCEEDLNLAYRWWPASETHAAPHCRGPSAPHDRAPQGKLVGRLAHGAPSYSGVGASGKLGAVQSALHLLLERRDGQLRNLCLARTAELHRGCKLRDTGTTAFG
jgi:Transposase domain (DUF772)